MNQKLDTACCQWIWSKCLSGYIILQVAKTKQDIMHEMKWIIIFEWIFACGYVNTKSWGLMCQE